MCMLDKFWQLLLPLIGREDLASDARFATGTLRGDNRAALTEELDDAFAERTTDEWIEILSGIVPVGPFMTSGVRLKIHSSKRLAWSGTFRIRCLQL